MNLSPEQRRRNQWIVVARTLGAFGCAVALIVLPIWWLGYSHGQASLSWPVVSGNIISSEVRSERAGRSLTYRPVVRYRFRVDGREYSNTRVFFGNNASAREAEAQERAARYPAGRVVEVRYQPGRPEESVLEPGPAPDGWFVLAIGGAALALGLGFGIPGFRTRLAR